MVINFCIYKTVQFSRNVQKPNVRTADRSAFGRKFVSEIRKDRSDFGILFCLSYSIWYQTESRASFRNPNVFGFRHSTVVQNLDIHRIGCFSWPPKIALQQWQTILKLITGGREARGFIANLYYSSAVNVWKSKVSGFWTKLSISTKISVFRHIFKKKTVWNVNCMVFGQFTVSL